MPEVTTAGAGWASDGPPVPAASSATPEAAGTFLFGTAVLAAALGALATSMTVLAVPLAVLGLLGWALAGCAWREGRTGPRDLRAGRGDR